MKTLEILQNNAISKQDMNQLKGGARIVVKNIVKCAFYDVSTGKKILINEGITYDIDPIDAEITLNSLHNQMGMSVDCWNI